MNNAYNTSICPQTVIIGKHEKVIEKLTKKGIRCIVLENNENIEHSVRNHADMSAYKLSDGRIILDKRQKKAAEELQKIGVSVVFTEENISGAYPADVLLNAARIGKTVICNEKFISREIISDSEDIISVRQGYAKCSICEVCDRAFITDDKGIYEKCRERFDILLIEKGDIILEGQSYGFIGGASAKIGEKIIFFGSLDTHCDGEIIKAFLKKHNVVFECLSDDNLTDIGSAVQI